MTQKRIFPGSTSLSTKRPRFRWLEFLLFTFFLISLWLIIFGIDIYRNTFIQIKDFVIPVTLGLILMVVVLFFIAKGALRIFYLFFVAALIGGGIPYFTLLYLNKKFASEEVNSESFEIISRGNLARGRKGKCRAPYALINFYGKEKELIFPCSFETSLPNYRFVKVDYVTGAFGFEVIKSKTLIR